MPGAEAMKVAHSTAPGKMRIIFCMMISSVDDLETREGRLNKLWPGLDNDIPTRWSAGLSMITNLFGIP
jgi:hypothetical protein